MSGLTGFDVSLNGVPTDLSYIFQPYSSGSNPTTNYIAKNGLDLSNIFQPLYLSSIYNITSNSNNIDITNNISNNLYNISIGKKSTSGTVTIEFLQSITATVMLVGGGGGGGPQPGGFIAGAGGGGETLFFSYYFSSGSSYSFFLGSGANGYSSSTTLTTYTSNNGLPGDIGTNNPVGGNGGGTNGNGGQGGSLSDGTNGTYANISNVYSIGGGGGAAGGGAGAGDYAGGGCCGYDYVVGTKSLPFPLTSDSVSSNISFGGSTTGIQGGGSPTHSGDIGGGGGGGGVITDGGYGWCLITFDATVLPQAPITNYKFFNTITGITQDLNQIFAPLS